jgi:calcium permeable stress-gated cation channel
MPRGYRCTQHFTDKRIIQFTEDAFWASLATSVIITLSIALLFCFVRPYNSAVYAPKLRHSDAQHAPPVIGKGLFAWVGPIIKTKEAALVDKLGLDATVFLRFTRMCRNLFLVMSVIGIAVMIPVNVTNSNQSSGKLGAFVLMTPQNLGGKPMWAHVVCAWAFDIIVAGFLWWNYRAVVRLRRNYFLSAEYQASLSSRTLMVTDIPLSSRSDEGLSRIIDEVKPTGGIPRAAIGRNVKELPELIEQHEKTVRQLESVLAKYLKNPDNLPAKRPTCSASKKDRSFKAGQKVDAIEYLSGRIRDLETEIMEVRSSVDKRNAMPYGFASYDTIDDAHHMAFAARKKHPQGSTIKLAPRPNDIIWNNLPLSKKTRRWKRTMINFWVAVLTIIWIAPNALIAVFLANLNNLGQVWPAFRTQLNGHPKPWAIAQGILSPAVMSLIYLLLPIMFRRLSMRGGDSTKTSRERHVTHQLYAFFVFNNLIVFSFFGCIWTIVSNLIDRSKGESFIDALKDAHIADNLTVALCTVSQYWITWVLQRNLGAAVDLAQAFQLLWTWFAKTFMHPTPRQLIEWTAPQPFDYASYYNYVSPFCHSLECNY